ncbi:molybdate ABC transporter substrate-binding protein [Palleronia rufa]|uniref:molybdate ABC transporter substrate-binding protein n=1 Tax=Palleronia rufa TaxID=1530186 RepID=UPI000566F33D|nr:molybdate ABC transporter substrate-binding protein [Palleronia rufa]
MLLRVATVLLLVLALPAAAAEVTLFAAASLKTALDRLAPAAKIATGHELRLVLAGSSALARQIQNGAPADLFVSANEDWMDMLEADGLLARGTRRDLLTNTLVLVGTDPVPVALADLPTALGDARLAMALVDAVPAGIYGKAALTSLGLWDSLSPRVAQTDNVRAALSLVAAGESPFGVVYATDALAEPRVTVLARFPEGAHPPIRYPVAAIAPVSPAAQEMLDWLDSPEARAIFAENGFGPPG